MKTTLKILCAVGLAGLLIAGLLHLLVSGSPCGFTLVEWGGAQVK